MLTLFRVLAICIGMTTTTLAAQPVETVRQDAGKSVSVRFLDRTSDHCWIEFDGPRHHAEAELARHGFHPTERGGRYQMRIEVTGERSERFAGHVRCVGFLRVVVEPADQTVSSSLVVDQTLPLRASNEWPDFNLAVLTAIDRVIAGL